MTFVVANQLSYYNSIIHVITSDNFSFQLKLLRNLTRKMARPEIEEFRKLTAFRNKICKVTMFELLKQKIIWRNKNSSVIRRGSFVILD
jgi:hypothetical protein